MKIEVIVGENDPVIYLIEKMKFFVGKDTTCEVVIQDHEVSRKHLEIISQGGNVFVVDLGSTNGTYLNEEKIAVGEKIEFHSFFPIRLGTNVLLSRVEDEQIEVNEQKNVSNALSTSDSTVVVSLKDLRTPKTQSMVQKKLNRQKKNSEKKAVDSKIRKKISISPANIIALIILCGAGVYTITTKLNTGESQKLAGKSIVVPEITSAKKLKQDALLIPAIQLVFEKEKCMKDAEILMCTTIGKARLENETLYVQVNGKKHFDEAIRIAGADFPAHGLSQIASALFLMDEIKPDFHYATVKNYQLVFALYPDETSRRISVVVSIKPENLENVKVLLIRRRLDAIKEKGLEVLKFTEDYYRVTENLNAT